MGLQLAEIPRQDFDLHTMDMSKDIGHMKLGDAYQKFVKDGQADIPWQVRLLENPNSPFAFPGSINLHGHDCIHLLLNRGISNFDEAFVVGFTMGNCSRVKDKHLQIFKVLSKVIYPRPYRFTAWHLLVLDLGFQYGRKIESKNLNEIDFGLYYGWEIKDLRIRFNISIQEITSLFKANEKNYKNHSPV
jgi:hypothetical protein